MKMGGTGLESWQRKKSGQLLLKLIGSALILAAIVHLFFYRNDAIGPLKAGKQLRGSLAYQSGSQDGMVPETALDIGIDQYQKGSLAYQSGSQDDMVPETALDIGIDQSQKGVCNLFTGQWIQNSAGPAYTNNSCRFIEPPQNCMKNGRPDTEYLYWRWKPKDCDLASFDAKKFLDVMRNKTWALIGDSIFRNHANSLLCFLSKVEDPIEVYHDKTYKSRTWNFASHNFTLALVWTPFLVKADIFEDQDGKATSDPQLHLDTLDSIWTSQYHNFDYILISGGQWFLKNSIYLEKSAIIGCHHCYVKNIPELQFEHTYPKVLEHVFKFVAASKHKPLVIYRTWAPDHFENGEWFSGGTCDRRLPYKEGDYNGSDLDRIMYQIELKEFNKAVAGGSKNGARARLKLMDTFHLSLLRPDGHPGPYRNFHPLNNGKDAEVRDCLHWCLPGPVDSWNDMVMEMVLNE